MFTEHPTAEWEGLRPTGALDAPEPTLPQGAYGGSSADFESIPELAKPIGSTAAPAELLAPAGGLDAGFAAFQYGADAIYLGLKKFSARAEAENFTLEEVDEITSYAHAMTPPRRVFVTINTVIQQHELAELVEAVAELARIGVDAIILQDLGVYYLLKHYFPGLELHGSTQIAVHNRAGAETLRKLGFHRVVLARELTFEEVRDITSAAGIETEVFIHGALCYSYSGLCLFSSQTLGRSGNRGKCAYSCRDEFTVTNAPMELRDGSAVRRDPSTGFPFSMKDLALPDHLPALRAAGVSCFKIEGRKKSPLYVATTTDFYRRLLDGKLQAEERTEQESALQTVFSRPWTKLFLDSHKDKEVADRDTVGHRGTPIGKVLRVRRVSGHDYRLQFHTDRDLERHDGLQVDLPGRPFGLPIDHLWLLSEAKPREVFEAAAGSLVEVGLPPEHPEIPLGATVYCSSSQAVKRSFGHDRPKPNSYLRRTPTAMELIVTRESVQAVARAEGLEVQAVLSGPFDVARDEAGTQRAARTTFEKLGDTKLSLESFSFSNEGNWFVPVSKLNPLRRELTRKLEQELQAQHTRRTQAILAEVLPRNAGPTTPAEGFRWSIKVDRIGYLDALEPDDWLGLDEVIVDITRDHPSTLQQRLDVFRERLGVERIRLALPSLTRKWEEHSIMLKIRKLLDAGWHRWEAGNLSAWELFPECTGIDLATDWPIYVVNRLAALQLRDMGVSRFCLSPEDGLANISSLLAEFADRAVLVVYQDTPLFLAESCAYANLIGGCPGKANCKFESMQMISTHGEQVTAIDYHCRTIVLNHEPFSLAHRLSDLAKAGARRLRADFIFRKFEPTEVRDLWRTIRAGRRVPGAQSANFDRGLL
jgi:putative protease